MQNPHDTISILEEDFKPSSKVENEDAISISDEALRKSFYNPEHEAAAEVTTTPSSNRFFTPTDLKLFARAGTATLSAGAIAAGVLAVLGIAAAITTPVGIALGAAAALAIFALFVQAYRNAKAQAPAPAPAQPSA